MSKLWEGGGGARWRHGERWGGEGWSGGRWERLSSQGLQRGEVSKILKGDYGIGHKKQPVFLG